MPAFTTEASVRLKFQIADTVNVPSELVDSCIDTAHEEILRVLAEDIDMQSPENAVVMAETLLAGARLFEALASHDAFTQKRITLGPNHIEDGDRFRALTSAAALAEKHAWYLLEPYTRPRPFRSCIEPTVTIPILGED
ncbi:MAG: hypothetical protein K1Y02_22105 [Candidatus Hydrogenedentes bacterium]|nr:hypothetical protein [Candidatus Hydrogenedentota bacterium]